MSINKTIVLSDAVWSRLETYRAPFEKDDGLLSRLIDAFEASLSKEEKEADSHDLVPLTSSYKSVVNKLWDYESVTLPVKRNRSSAMTPVMVGARLRTRPRYPISFYISLPHQQVLHAEDWGRARSKHGQPLGPISRALDDWCQGKLPALSTVINLDYPLKAESLQTRFKVAQDTDKLLLCYSPSPMDGSERPDDAFALDEVVAILRALRHEGGVDDNVGQGDISPERITQVIEQRCGHQRAEAAVFLATYLEEIGLFSKINETGSWRIDAAEGEITREALLDAIHDYEQDF